MPVKPPDEDLNAGLNRTASLIQLLVKDANFALTEARAASEELQPYRRRVFVRAFMALVEGHCYCHRNLLLNFTHLFEYRFSHSELLKLQELKEKTDPKTGIPHQERQWLTLDDGLKISFDWTAKAFGFKFQINKQSDGYIAFTETKKLRDYLMHPKKSANLVIGETQFQQVEKAYSWFIGEVGRANQKLSELVARDAIKFGLAVC